MPVKDRIESEIFKLYVDTGIDVSNLPAVMTAKELAPVLNVTVGSLANDRYRRVGVPFTKISGRVRYLRADVVRYLVANRTEHAGT